MASGGPAVAGESLGIRPMLSESCQRDVVMRALDTSEAAPGIVRKSRQTAFPNIEEQALQVRRLIVFRPPSPKRGCGGAVPPARNTNVQGIKSVPPPHFFFGAARRRRAAQKKASAKTCSRRVFCPEAPKGALLNCTSLRVPVTFKTPQRHPRQKKRRRELRRCCAWLVGPPTREAGSDPGVTPCCRNRRPPSPSATAAAATANSSALGRVFSLSI